MRLEIQLIDNIPIIAIKSATLDAANIEIFRKEISGILTPYSDAVIDLSGLDFMDSSGLGALLSCMRRLRAKGGDMRLANMNDEIRTLFALVRMERIMDVCDSSDHAIRLFTKEFVEE